MLIVFIGNHSDSAPITCVGQVPGMCLAVKEILFSFSLNSLQKGPIQLRDYPCFSHSCIFWDCEVIKSLHSHNCFSVPVVWFFRLDILHQNWITQVRYWTESAFRWYGKPQTMVCCEGAACPVHTDDSLLLPSSSNISKSSTPQTLAHRGNQIRAYSLWFVQGCKPWVRVQTPQ